VSPELTAPPLRRHAFTAFGGASCEILTVNGSEDDLSAAVAEVYAFEARLTRFRPDSELSRFNAQAGEPTAVSPLLEVLLRACLDAFTLSEGLVNAAVHDALVRAGYDRSIEAVRAGPPAAAVPHVPVAPLPDVLELGDGWARLRAGWAIDLGGVGKGWLADSLCERFDNACVVLGGDLHAEGGGPHGDGWPVGLCDGRTVRVRSGGVASSGTTGRRWQGGHHLIDPRTGAPARTDALVVSVAAADCLTAETLAKSGVILGSRLAPRWLRDHGAVQQAALWGAPVGGPG
jgi:thiamine biosynthesis lipoprotein